MKLPSIWKSVPKYFITGFRLILLWISIRAKRDNIYRTFHIYREYRLLNIMIKKGCST